jgi:hypothetical protein
MFDHAFLPPKRFFNPCRGIVIFYFIPVVSPLLRLNHRLRLFKASGL